MKELSLEERKEISLEILFEIDRVCNKYKIPYYLAYGSLLGAIRHKGFIPWDDDIDIWIPIESYWFFLSVMQDETRYEILDWKNQRNDWKDSFAKISDSRTVVKRYDGKASPDRGVSVDVFPLMPIGDSIWVRDVMRQNRWVQRIIAFRYNLFSTSLLSIIRKLSCYIQLLLCKDEIYWNKKIEAAVNNVQDATKCGCPISSYGLKDSFRLECFERSIKIEFEGSLFPAPLLYDEVLTNLYNDYMIPPEKQVSNHDVIVFWRP